MGKHGDNGAGNRQQQQIDQANSERMQLTKDAYDKAIATMRANDAERYNPTAPGAPATADPLGPGGIQPMPAPPSPILPANPVNSGPDSQNVGSM